MADRWKVKTSEVFFSAEKTICLALAFAVLPFPETGNRDDYDPLDVTSGTPSRKIALTVQDKTRNREIPILVYLPPNPNPDNSAVILFSHGLGGSRNACSYLGEHWAKRGYVAVFLQHPGSDSSVWQAVPLRQRMRTLQKAGNNKNFQLRVGDVKTVLNQLETWSTEQGHRLSGLMNLNKIGMAGHSFGAMTTQAVSGQTFPGPQSDFADERITAAIALSPSSSSRDKPESAFGKVAIPWMLMTGTHDAAPFGTSVDPRSRLKVFPSLPPGGKYELVLDKAEHDAFTQVKRRRQTSRNPNHHRAILGLSTAFWDAHLCDNPHATAWLQGPGPRSLLEKQDRWQTK